MLNEIGRCLKQRRNKLNLSLKYVTQKTGITDSRLSRIEKGEKLPEPITLKLLADLYQMDLVNLYIQADYLDDTDLSSYQRVFYGSDLLSDDERKHIQEEINLFTKGRR